MSYYIGLMSGTSVDGVDAVLVKDNHLNNQASGAGEVILHTFTKFSDGLDQALLDLHQSGYCSLKLLGQLDHRLGHFYADATFSLLNDAGIKSEDIIAIGSHGQTVFHYPEHEDFPFTMQLGDSNILAARTGIPVVSDFRRMDMAFGGNGAPLTPLLHHILFSSEDEVRAVINLGGIANITVLKPDNPVTGFDSGPANCLMDYWIQQYDSSLFYDDKGQWAASGKINERLLKQMLADNYFRKLPPKTTGKELFNGTWLQMHISQYESTLSEKISPEDIQATLCELTASVVAHDIIKYAGDSRSIYFCGGGTYNQHLIRRMSLLLAEKNLLTTDALGMPVEHVEAVAFALLARYRLERIPGNMPSVTGATGAALLGAVYRPE